MRRAFTAVALTGASVLLLAACGSSGSDTASTATISKAAFVQQANAICAKGNKEIDKAANQIFSGGQPTSAQFEEFATGTLIPSVETQVAAISALPVPSGDEAQVQAILDAAQQGIDEAKQDPAALQGNADPFKQANTLANEYGMTACGG